MKTFKDFIESGLLWYVNRVAFHPRGYALAFELDDQDNVVGWTLLGDGSELWTFGDDLKEDKHFANVERLFNNE